MLFRNGYTGRVLHNKKYRILGKKKYDRNQNGFRAGKNFAADRYGTYPDRWDKIIRRTVCFSGKPESDK